MLKSKKHILVLFFMNILCSFQYVLAADTTQVFEEYKLAIQQDFKNIEELLEKKEGVYVFHSSTTFEQTNNDEIYLRWARNMTHPAIKAQYAVANIGDEDAINKTLENVDSKTNRKLIVYITSILTYPKEDVNRRGQLTVNHFIDKATKVIEDELYGSSGSEKTFSVISVIRINEFIITLKKNGKKTTAYFETTDNISEKINRKHQIRVLPAKYISNPCIEAIKATFNAQVKTNLKTFVSQVADAFESQTCNPKIDCNEKAKALNDAISNKNSDNIKAAIDALLVPTGQVSGGNRVVLKYGDAGLSYDYYQKALRECITLDQRITAIKTLLELKWVSTPYENVIIDFIKYAPVAQQIDLLNGLLSTKTDGKTLLTALFQSVDGAQFDALISELWIVIKAVKPSTSSVGKLYADDKSHLFGRGSATSGLSFSQSIDNDGKITLTSETSRLNDDYYEPGRSYKHTTESKDPYEYILIDFKTDYLLPNKTYYKYTPVMLPACVVYGLFNYENNTRNLNTGKLVLDVGLIALGVGEINAAIKAGQLGWRFAFAVADVGIGSTDLVIQNVFLDKLSQTKEGQNFLSAWTRIQLLYVGGSLTQLALQKVALKKAFDAIDSNKGICTLPEGGTLTYTKAEQDKLKEIVNKAEGLKVIDEVFESARQFIRNNYGQDFLNQITLKYGKENTGALAVLVKRFGDEGADLLNQEKTLDEIASALVKERVVYRHIGSQAGYLEGLKSTGKIPGGYTTYFSADKFDDPVEAISKMQLNSEWTDAVWVAEFDGAQLVGKVEIPKAKWNEASYLEVLTKSFPKWGKGGATQFITKSEINISKLRNLKTGELIDFTNKINLKGAKGLIGKDFENFLTKNLPNASTGFSKGGRDFDASYNSGTIWVEAKSGRYWEEQLSNSAGIEKFKSDMGSRLKIASDNSAKYELFSNTSIPNFIKTWLESKGIKFFEILD